VNAIFRDGLGINDQGSIALDNKEAVEITKGLSATRNGVTSPGGSVNYVIKRPLAQPLTRVSTNVDGFGGYGASADVSRRFGTDDRFGVRINVAGDEIRSFVDEVEGERTFVSAAFDWRVTERLLLEAEVERQHKEINTAFSPGLSAFATIADARAFFSRLNAETRPTQPWAVEPNTQLYLSGRGTYEISDAWRLRVAGHRATLDRDQRSVRATAIQPNGDYTITPYISLDQQRNNTAWQTVLEGDVETGVLLHELAAGYDYIRRDMIYGPAFTTPLGTGNLFNDIVVPDPNPVLGPSFLAARSDQHSVFLTDTIKFDDWLQLFGGARLTRLNNYTGTGVGPLTETYDKDVVTPTAGIVIKPRRSVSLYASYAEGIEQGGTAPVGTVNANEVFGPLESNQIEVGVKFELPRGALLTVAAFRIDKGLEFIDAGTNTYVQDGRQVHEGIEVTLGGPVTEKLRLVAGAAFLDAQVERTANPALIGMSPQGVPEWQANLYADYDLSDLITGLSINAGVYYTGEKAIDQLNTWMADDYVRIDAGLRYRHRISKTTTATYRLNVENLTDERYLSDTSFGGLVFGSPVAVKLSAAFEF
jgi:iron complex outermembrane receptor protein